jgi:hypothetical protein
MGSMSQWTFILVEVVMREGIGIIYIVFGVVEEVVLGRRLGGRDV